MSKRSRLDKLYKHLEGLEAQLLPYVIDELKKIIKEYHRSEFFRSISYPFEYYGKKKVSDNYKIMNNLFNEIISLRKKLKLNLNEGVIGVILEYEEIEKKKGPIWGFHEPWVEFAREQLLKLENIIDKNDK